jgi:hypothetical protein
MAIFIVQSCPKAKGFNAAIQAKLPPAMFIALRCSSLAEIT